MRVRFLAAWLRSWGLLLVLAAGASSCAGWVERIGARLSRVPGRWGVFFRDLATGETLAIRARQGFHPASTRKILVLLKVDADVRAGRYGRDDLLAVEDVFPSAIVGAAPFRVGATSGVVRGARGGRLPLRALLRAMIEDSDNLATNLLIRRAGGPAAVTRHARRLGLRRSSVRTYVGDVAAHRAGRRSVGVPREYGLLLERLWRDRSGAGARILEILRRPGPGWIGRLLPRPARIAHKPGRIEGVRSDAALVVLPAGRAYVLCIMGEGLADGAAGEDAIARVSRWLYEHVAASQRP